MDVKDAFSQVPQKVKVLCRIPSEAEAIVAKMVGVEIDSLTHFRWKLSVFYQDNMTQPYFGQTVATTC